MLFYFLLSQTKKKEEGVCLFPLATRGKKKISETEKKGGGRGHILLLKNEGKGKEKTLPSFLFGGGGKRSLDRKEKKGGKGP